METTRKIPAAALHFDASTTVFAEAADGLRKFSGVAYAGGVITGHFYWGRVAFDLARTRKNKVHSADKKNVMKSGVLWDEVAHAVAKDYADVEFHHILADNAAMQLVRNPKQFDVIVTDNLFGDILSDEASMLTGSLGMLPSASLGAKDAKTGKAKALYEPIHGSAPDIAGKNLANPIAAILSLAMCLRYSLEREADAKLIEDAVAAVLDAGIRTGDIMQAGKTQVSTTGMGDAILAALDKAAR